MTRSTWARRFGRIGSSLLLVGACGACQSAASADDGVGGLGGGGGSGSEGSHSSGGGSGGGADEFAACPSGTGDFASTVRDHEFGPGQDVGQDDFPDLVLGPPHGLGTGQGSTDDVVSLGDGGFVELGFGEAVIVDAPGVDFLVFENPFFVGGDPEEPFAELGEVSVSEDGVTWRTFPCHAESYPYEGCAGWHPVLANPEENDLDPTDPEAAGGDPFDLADVGLSFARYVRITDVSDGAGTSFDLDAVSVVHPGCP